MGNIRWDICLYFHGMNDFGRSDDGKGYSRSHTYSGECYADEEEKRCTRKGRCVLRYGGDSQTRVKRVKKDVG